HDVQVGRRIFDRAEHDDPVALRIRIARQAAATDPRERDLELASVNRLVHEQEIADEQRVLHARRRDAERLNQVGSEHDPDADRHRDRARPPFGPPVERTQALEDRGLLRGLLHGDRKLGAPWTPGNRSWEPVSWYNWNS